MSEVSFERAFYARTEVGGIGKNRRVDNQTIASCLCVEEDGQVFGDVISIRIEEYHDQQTAQFFGCKTSVNDIIVSLQELEEIVKKGREFIKANSLPRI